MALKNQANRGPRRKEEHQVDIFCPTVFCASKTKIKVARYKFSSVFGGMSMENQNGSILLTLNAACISVVQQFSVRS